MTTHGCPAPDCRHQVPHNQLACKRHWYALPKPLRDDVWTAYRKHGQGSDQHTAAITAAIDWLADHA
jgi:hypothetical protein